ncbi:MAG TPA: NADH-quinone oxidoreductase subunit C, partial [Deltaproteobacteria bacterium]|nr:NADH-quinone oxidoreductase subunit C [Deltaproteobacteria bacterium]
MVEKDSIHEALDHLKYDRDLSFNMLVDLFAVDYMGEEPRFEVVYILRSTKHNGRVVVKTRTGDEGLDTISDLWPAA